MSKLNIAYACNEAYISHTGISMLSLFDNNKSFDEISVYFIAKDVSDESILLLKDIATKYHRNFIVIPFESITQRLEINTLGRHIETIYAKLFFAQIEEIDKILYIDSDTIINDSLVELWNIDISDYLVAGVETYTVDAKVKLGLSSKDNFINDGVVLLNLKQFRKLNIEDEFVRRIAYFNGNPPVLSEGIINFVCKGKILSIHPRYNLLSGLFKYKKNIFSNMNNYYSKETIKDAIKKPVIIHYLSAFYNRPWDLDCTHPLKEKYMYYKSLSYWKDLPFKDGKLSFRLRVIKILYNIFPNTLLNYFRYLLKKRN